MDRDDQYLFRLASTFGWEELVHYCHLMIAGFCGEAATDACDRATSTANANSPFAPWESEFGQYCDEDDSCDGTHCPPEVARQRRWLAHGHEQLTYTDQWGNSPLHAACYVKPPMEVVHTLLLTGRILCQMQKQISLDYVNSKKAEGLVCNKETNTCNNEIKIVIPQLWELKSNDGSTPLLVACSTGASNQVVQCFLTEVEHYIAHQTAAPSVANEIALRVRGVVLMADDLGNSPLSAYMLFHQSWIQRQLSRIATPSIPVHVGKEALFALTDYWRVVSRMLQFVTGTEAKLDGGLGGSVYPNTIIHQSLTSRADVRNGSPTLVHRCASIACHCPLVLMQWMVSKHYYWDYISNPAEASAATVDDDGYLPLHRAIEARIALSKATATSITITSHPKLEKNQVDMMKQLLRWNSNAARTRLPQESGGRTPLCHAIANGLSWHINTDDDSKGNDGAHDGPVKLLWKHAPELATEVDPVTKLYPFMLAATTISSTRSKTVTNKTMEVESDKVGNHHECRVVEMVYNLLRFDPQLAQGASMI